MLQRRKPGMEDIEVFDGFRPLKKDASEAYGPPPCNRFETTSLPVTTDATASTTVGATSPSAQKDDVHATFESFLEKRVEDYCAKKVILSNKEVKKFVEQAKCSITPNVSEGPPVAASTTGNASEKRRRLRLQLISGLKTRITDEYTEACDVEGTVEFKIKGSHKIKYSLPNDRLRKVFQRSVAVKNLPEVKRQTVTDTETVVLSGPIKYDRSVLCK